MANKKETEVNNTAKALGAKAAADADAASASNTALEGSIIPKYQDMYANPMSSEEKGARFSAATGPMDAARGAIEERAGRSHNAAGINEMEGKLALDKSVSLGQTAAGIGDTETARRADALKGLSGMYGIDSSLLAKKLGLPADYLGIQEKSAQNSQNPLFGQILGTAGGVAGAYLGRKSG